MCCQAIAGAVANPALAGIPAHEALQNEIVKLKSQGNPRQMLSVCLLHAAIPVSDGRRQDWLEGHVYTCIQCTYSLT